MRILIDTNIIIPLEDIEVDFNKKLAELSRLASGKHELLIHPASIEDIKRDKNPKRRLAMLKRAEKYNELSSPPELQAQEEIELFGKPTKANHNVDNRILFSVFQDCAHWLVTEDDGIHRKAKKLGISERVLLIDQIIQSLHKIDSRSINLYPQIKEIPCHNLQLDDEIFNSLRHGYDGFDVWFREKCCQTGRHAWVYNKPDGLGAICIYKNEENPIVTVDNKGLPGKTLKLCTFKVERRGFKIGELLLKQSFTYAIDNRIDQIYVTVDPDDHNLLHDLFLDFGFVNYGIDRGGRDDVYVKNFPKSPPNCDEPPLEYAIKYFPKFKLQGNSAFLVPIKPEFHQILFPELKKQYGLFDSIYNSAGNAIKQAYLCKSPNKSIKPGDILFFYRTQDEKSITSYGVVDQFYIERDPEKIFQWVSKRTVYSYEDISTMASAGKAVKVILFRLLGHFKNKVSYSQLMQDGVVSGPIQSIMSIDKRAVIKLLSEASCNDCFISH